MRTAFAVLLVGCTGGELPFDCDAPGHICTVAGTGMRGFGEAGQDALATHLFLPTDVGFLPDGRALIVDYNNNRVLRLELDGTLTRVAGIGVHAYAIDGAPALESPLENPIAIAVGDEGAYYLQEQHGARVLRVSTDGWIDVVAGDADNPGYEGWEGDGGPAREAVMSQSVGLARASDGTLFIADTRNHCVRRVDPDGVMHAVAGNGEAVHVDGIGEFASFDSPHHLAWHDDGAGGRLIVADALNHRVREVRLGTREVRTLAGGAMRGFAGDGGPAEDALLDSPQGVAVDAEGRVLIADSENHVVRRIEADGRIVTVAGVGGTGGYAGDGGPATEALLQWPTNLSVAPDGAIWVSDTLNSVIRVIR